MANERNMSNPRPNAPRSRRRIAGERKPRSATPLERPGEAPPRWGTGGPDTGEAPPPSTTPDLADEGPTVPSVETATDREPAGRAAGAGGEGVALWMLVTLAVLAVVLVATAAFLGIPGLRTVSEQTAVEATERTAPAAAERAAVAILSYDYKSLDSDRDAAVRYMTDGYRKQYVKTFDSLVKGNATKLRAKVEAKVVASGVSAADDRRARVLLFLDQTTTSTANGGEPQVALNRVMFDMVEQDGTWRVNDITSY